MSITWDGEPRKYCKFTYNIQRKENMWHNNIPAKHLAK